MLHPRGAYLSGLPGSSQARAPQLHDTTNTPYLRGQKPDLTLATGGIGTVEAEFVYSVIEVKPRERRGPWSGFRQFAP